MNLSSLTKQFLKDALADVLTAYALTLKPENPEDAYELSQIDKFVIRMGLQKIPEIGSAKTYEFIEKGDLKSLNEELRKAGS